MRLSIDSPATALSGVLHAFVIAAAVLFFAHAVWTPQQNWDMLGYAASALELTGKDITTIHAEVYRDLRDYVAQAEFEELSSGSSYRQAMADDAGAFAQQIPYYQIRIVFVTLMLLLSAAGVGLFQAGHILAAASAALGFAVFFYAFKPFVRPPFWLLLPLVYFLCGVHDTARVVTPDAMAFLWLGLICFAFLREHGALFPLLALSVLVRTDMVVLVALVLGYLVLFRPRLRTRSLVTGLVTALIYVALNQLAGNHGWTTVFYFVFVSDMLATHPEEYARLGLSFGQYISAVIANLESLLHDNRFVLFLVNVLLQLILFLRLQERLALSGAALLELARNPAMALSLIACGYVALHYLLYPAIWSRFFIGQYLLAYLGLLYVLSGAPPTTIKMPAGSR